MGIIILHYDGDEDDNGIAVAIVRVKAVCPFVLADMQAACASYFEGGWLAWELSDLRPVTRSVVIQAARSIYEVDFCFQTSAEHYTHLRLKMAR
ncbi:hypothetical protein SAMN04490208_0401 [Pseudomonas poae]|uniref:Uncharacterized protein n=1 Tax=Pseudomonas poae TaxID=200451 RepID=A0ABY0RB04_9PSED|nr:hypothetical protein [Pseudomonas poae]SDN46420.1 hypothetical protein SAMN04490208_0401 [Pseudomonas poae]